MGCASSMPITPLDIMDGQHASKESGCQIIRLVYFENLWGRKSPIEFMMYKAGLSFEVTRLSLLDYYGPMGAKGKLGGLPVGIRSDGTFMSETQPIARYIARHCGFYPTNPLECFYCDKYAILYEPIINGVFKWASTFMGEK